MRLILSALLIGLLLPAAARAHAMLKSAIPAAGSTVAVPPTEVLLRFSESVEPSFSKIIVRSANGAPVTAGIIHRGKDDTELAVPLASLHTGTYKVTWRAVSQDAHKTTGSFTFSVTP